MTKILLLHHHRMPINGTFTSIVDLFFNLRGEGVECDCKLICHEQPRQTIDFFRSNQYFGDKSFIKHCTYDTKFESTIIIASIKLLDDIKTYGIEIKCDYLILLDSLDVVKAHYGLIPPLESPIKNTLLFCNPATFELAYKDFKCCSYLHKFSHTRMKTVPVKEHVEYNRMTKAKIHGYEFENIGKEIFEQLYHGGSINYHGSDVMDGLYWYLHAIGIDGTKDYKNLKVDRGLIEDNLFMDPYDSILMLL